METFSALLAICEGNPQVTGGFPLQRLVARSFDVFFDLRLNNGSANKRDAGDLRRHRAHCDVTLMSYICDLYPYFILNFLVTMTEIVMRGINIGHIVKKNTVTHMNTDFFLEPKFFKHIRVFVEK